MYEISTYGCCFFMDINRPYWIQKIEEEFEIHRVCALLGPRQCGKTTLARAYQKSVRGSYPFF
jgi:predicted AAA+ superfamily ATPase